MKKTGCCLGWLLFNFFTAAVLQSTFYVETHVQKRSLARMNQLNESIHHQQHTKSNNLQKSVGDDVAYCTQQVSWGYLIFQSEITITYEEEVKIFYCRTKEFTKR
jgi:hypothetical protein